MRKLDIHLRLNYSRRCTEARIAFWLQAWRSDGMLPKWDLDAERDASEFHEGYCGRLLEKALEEVTFVLLRDLHN